MATNLTVNNQPAVKIFARKLKERDKSILFDCEGNKVWLSKSCIKVVTNETILIQEWMYKQKFKN